MEESDKGGSKGNADNGVGNTEKVEKKHKKRQKKILAELQKQIEFYFSEPNLQKDRFLRQKISESDNGCVEIETIASFNRMKQLCKDISLIVKAMKLCPSVEVIDEKWVKPSKPLPEPKNVDSVTIYVERLPSHVDHNWIKTLFSSCGNVLYVSLPRYKSTGDIKGFAFVEFEKESEAQAALEMFTEKPNKEVEHEDELDPKSEDEEEHAGKHKKNKKRKAKLSESESEDTNTKSKKAKRKREDGSRTCSIPGATETKSNSNTGEDEPNKIKRNAESERLEQTSHKKAKRTEGKENELSGGGDSLGKDKSKKRKRKRSEASDDGATSSKKSKETQESDDYSCTSSKKNEDACEASAEDGAGEAEVRDEEMEDNKKKRRKRKKKEKQEVDVPKLRVISKTEWLRLKKEYQQLQREAMKDAKAKLKIEFEAKMEQAPKSIETETEKHKDKSDKDSFENNEETVSKEKKEPPQKLEMQAGVVLKFCSEKDIDKRQLRNLFLTIAPVAYLEKEDEKNTGHVRFATKEACDKVLETFSKSGSMEGITVEKLTEKEDEEYWDRLNKDRFDRFQGKKRNRNRRGRQKITRKLDERAAKKKDHIHFED